MSLPTLAFISPIVLCTTPNCLECQTTIFNRCIRLHPYQPDDFYLQPNPYSMFIYLPISFIVPAFQLPNLLRLLPSALLCTLITSNFTFLNNKCK